MPLIAGDALYPVLREVPLFSRGRSFLGEDPRPTLTCVALSRVGRPGASGDPDTAGLFSAIEAMRRARVGGREPGAPWEAEPSSQAHSFARVQ